MRFIVAEDFDGSRVDRALSALAEMPRAQVRRWIEAGLVQLDGTILVRASRRVRTGELLEARPPAPVECRVEAEDLPLQILYEDIDLIVIDKAAGMVVHPAPGHASGTLVNALLHHCGDLAGVGGVLRPGIVHRLDRGTRGVLVVAKNDIAHRVLSEQFRDHSIERLYLAFVRAAPSEQSGRIDCPIGRHPRDRKRMSVRAHKTRSAATRWSVRERYPAAQQSLLEVRPESGRTHQIRVHLASVGMPIAGDRVYGRAARRRPAAAGRERPALHAAALGFTHPRSRGRVRFEAAVPAAFALAQKEQRLIFLSIGTVGAMLNQLRVACFFGLLSGLAVVLERWGEPEAEART